MRAEMEEMEIEIRRGGIRVGDASDSGQSATLPEEMERGWPTMGEEERG